MAVAHRPATFQESSHASDIGGPILASFPALLPPATTDFTCYRDRADLANDAPFPRQRTLLAGESRSTSFYSINRDLGASNVGYSSDYLVGVRNKRTDVATVQPAPLYIISREVKRFKDVETGLSSVSRRLQARNVLGQTFGSKRARAAIQAAERNRVDVTAMGEVAHHLQTDIDINTSALPSLINAEATLNSSRPGPPCHADASQPSEVYPVDDIVPDSELGAISTKTLTSATSEIERSNILPYNRSKWLNDHLTFMCQASKPDKKKLRLLYYVSCMLCFRQAAFQTVDSEKLSARMSRVPQVVREGLLLRFTETSRGSSIARVTSEAEIKLLTYMFALCLHVDDFAVDINTLAHDLHMPLTKVVRLFKALGCKVEPPTAQDRDRLGLPKDQPLAKRAFLRLPLSFPRQRTAKRRA